MNKIHIQRNYYLDQLESFKNNGLIKVLTGVRRCGKSQLLIDFAKTLNENNVIFFNLEDRPFAELRKWTDLYDLVRDKLSEEKKNYIFLDEIQEIPEFEKAVNSLHLLPNVDIYLTGSNAYMLSGELVTYLSGRYIQIKIFPLSLSEYQSAYPNTDKYKLYENYVSNSSLPELLDFESFGSNGVQKYLETVYDTVVKKDVMLRNQIKDESKLQSVTNFLMQNVGNLVTPKRISDTLASKGRPVSNHTIENYIAYLQDSFLLYSVNRFDLIGKQILETNQKYYAVDIGLRNYLLSGPSAKNDGFVLENIVYLELLRRFAKVYIGKVRDMEIDFVCEAADKSLNFFQVALTVADSATLARELKSLQTAKYQGNKYILTLDPFTQNYDGIMQFNAIEWLLKGGKNE